MTFIAGGNIQASDYNGFATNLNRIYADLYSGTTTLPSAGYGYGQSGALLPVSVSGNITSTQWETMRQRTISLGTHQGTTVIPPLQATPIIPGEAISAYSLVPLTLLDTNRFNLAAGQSSQTTAVSSGTSTPWQYQLIYTFQVNLGTWDQARFFFNSGGFISIAGSYPGSGYPPYSDDYMWYTFLNQVGPINLKALTTVAGLLNSATTTGGNPTAGGLWSTNNNPLTVGYQTIYYSAYGAGYYNASTIRLEARLSAVAPTAASGIIQFKITLAQPTGNVPYDPKLENTAFTMTETHSGGTIPFLSGGGGPGPAAITITPGSFTIS